MATVEDVTVGNTNTAVVRLIDPGANNKYLQPIVPFAGPQETAVREYGSTTSLLSAGLNSLATSTTVGYASNEVDLTAIYADDVLFVVTYKMTTSGSPTGYIDTFLLASLDGTTYSGDTTYSGTAASYTLGAASSPNLRWACSVKAHANTAAYQGEFSVKAVMGYVPAFLAVVVLNNTGIALHTSGSDVSYRVRY